MTKVIAIQQEDIRYLLLKEICAKRSSKLSDKSFVCSNINKTGFHLCHAHFLQQSMVHSTFLPAYT